MQELRAHTHPEGGRRRQLATRHESWCHGAPWGWPTRPEPAEEINAPVRPQGSGESAGPSPPQGRGVWRERLRGQSIWLCALGYFSAYVPYSALTKVLSSGLAPSLGGPVDGPALLPVSVAASTVGMFALISALGWWRSASQATVAGVRLPRPGRWTLLSGLCTAAVMLTTTLAYTFRGASIVFMMLLMRGGVLVLAPMVDALSGRRVRWFSWAALGLSLGALGVTVSPGSRAPLPLVAVADVATYLAAYFVRLRAMSRLAKGSDEDNRRFFVEEQMVASPAALAALVAVAVAGRGALADAVRRGFTEVPLGPAALAVVAVGLLSQLTGVFGGLILLDKRENSFAVPVNRASSVLAGVAAALALAALFPSQRAPDGREVAGAALVTGAILALTLGPRLGRRTT